MPFEIIKKTNIDFIGKRRIAFIFSGILVSLGIIGLFRIAFSWANIGIDFRSGTIVELSLEKLPPITTVREILRKNGFEGVEIEFFEGTQHMLIRSKFLPQPELLERVLGEYGAKVISAESIGPKISNELIVNAFWAMLLATIALLVYLAFRFEPRFGACAVVATVHDVLAVLGIMVNMNAEVNLLLVTALLTIAGYSLTDTVVVFDRIRSHLRLRKGVVDLKDIVNTSINEVLSRTVITSLTTMFVVISLLIWGSSVTRGFATALFLGIIIGTYSSIYIASSILVEWHGRRLSHVK